MKTLLLAGLAVLALGAGAAPAMAHDDGCDRSSRNYRGYRSYDTGSYRDRYYSDRYSGQGALDSRYYGRAGRHDYEHDKLERKHDRAHDRGFDGGRDHERWHEKASNHHDVIHHRVYGRHAPERQRSYRYR